MNTIDFLLMTFYYDAAALLLLNIIKMLRKLLYMYILYQNDYINVQQNINKTGWIGDE